MKSIFQGSRPAPTLVWGMLHPARGVRGLLLVLVLLLPLAAPAAQAANPITLNLNNADIGALITTVSKMTGKNFVVDPRVKGTVTVISAHPMSRSELYQVFLSVLQVHGYAAIPTGNIIKIVPDVRAKQDAVPVETPQSRSRGDEMVTRVIALKHVNAAQLVPVLRPLVPQSGHLAAYQDSNVLVISDRADNVRRLAQIVARVDQPSTTGIEVIPLQHASATDLVQTINSLNQGRKRREAHDQVHLAADARTNSILLSGDKAGLLRMRTLITSLDTPLTNSGSTQVIYLHYAKAKDLVPVLTGVSKTVRKKGKGTPPAAGETRVSIEADKSANALVITAPPAIMRSLREVVRKLDIRRAQVLVEAVIAEVSLDKSRELGVQWLIGHDSNNRAVVTGTNFSAGGSSLTSIASDIHAGNVPAIGDGLSLALGRIKGAVDYAALLRALAGDANTNILSTPSLMTLDNQEAEIVVGQNVPFVTGEYTNTGSTTNTVNPFQTIQRKDVGLTLKVTPQINAGDAVKLQIEQVVSSIAPSSQGAADIVTNKRSIKTTVMVENGHMIVLGGLINSDLEQTKQKVPLLGDMPLLGPLFRYNKTTKVKQDLMVFLRPIILRDPATTTDITNGKYDYMRARELDMRHQGVRLLPNKAAPVLRKQPVPKAKSPGKKTTGAPQDPPAQKKSNDAEDWYSPSAD